MSVNRAPDTLPVTQLTASKQYTHKVKKTDRFNVSWTSRVTVSMAVIHLSDNATKGGEVARLTALMF